MNVCNDDALIRSERQYIQEGKYWFVLLWGT